MEPGAGEDVVEDDGVLGCCPYLQLFKGRWGILAAWNRSVSAHASSPPDWCPTGGKLILTAPCSRDGSTGEARPSSSDGGVTMLPWAFPSDGSIIFAVDCVVQVRPAESLALTKLTSLVFTGLIFAHKPCSSMCRGTFWYGLAI